MTDRDRFGLRGSAKLCELHRIWYSRGCVADASKTEERNDVTVVEFGPDGSLERHWHKNPAPNASEWMNVYEYQDGNRLSTVRTEQGGTVTTTRRYEYDSAGRVSRMIMLGEDGQQRVGETYSYEADGRKKKITYLDPQLASGACGIPGACGTTFAVDGTDAAYGAPGATSITSVYDERGRPIEHLFHDSSEELVTCIDFRYDERGNLVEEVCTRQKLPPELVAQFRPEQLEVVGILFAIRTRHRYDEQDRRIETSLIMADNDRERRTFEYNDHGDVISQISELSEAKSGEISFGEEGRLTSMLDSTHWRRSVTQFRYQYDGHGNWVEKIVETPGGPIWSIERRTISYFE